MRIISEILYAASFTLLIMSFSSMNTDLKSAYGLLLMSGSVKIISDFFKSIAIRDDMKEKAAVEYWKQTKLTDYTIGRVRRKESITYVVRYQDRWLNEFDTSTEALCYVTKHSLGCANN